MSVRYLYRVMNPALLDGVSVQHRFLGVSALEVFFGLPAGLLTTVEADADLADLARLFDNIDFPGLPSWDARVRRDQGDLLIRTADIGHGSNGTELRDHPLLQFSWDPARRAFYDPHDLYPLLKEARGILKDKDSDADPLPVEGLRPLEAAVVCARFPFVPREPVRRWPPDHSLPPAFHRLLLTNVITGRYAWRGLEILKRCGYVDAILPELARMDQTDQSKEGHPEGNVWRHTVETLRYRKNPELLTGLALLLHDCGKPFAEANGTRRFDRHADIGADVAGKVLRRVGFDQTTIRDVRWLIQCHMIPGALPRLPDHRRDPVMASPLFPHLLEVYRCDLSSTFRGPDGYYRACEIYRRYRKRNKRR